MVFGGLTQRGRGPTMPLILISCRGLVKIENVL